MKIRCMSEQPHFKLNIQSDSKKTNFDIALNLKNSYIFKDNLPYFYEDPKPNIFERYFSKLQKEDYS